MWKRAFIPTILGFGLLWSFFVNIDWVIIHTFKPKMTPSIGQVMEKYKKKTGQRGIGATSYYIKVQGIKSPYCGGEADIDIRFFEQVRIKDQIPIFVKDDVCYVPEDVRWSGDFLFYYWYYLVSGLAGFALIGYALWKAIIGRPSS